MKKMNIVLAIFGAFLMSTGSTFANPLEGSDSQASPEITLLQNAIALEGQNLSIQQMQESVSQLITSYANTASVEGLQDRMERAFVAIGMYTPSQAHALVVEAGASARTLDMENLSSRAAVESSVSAEIAHLATAYPAGAQFSTCAPAELLGGLGGIGLGVGGVIWALSGNNMAQKSDAEMGVGISAISMIIGVALAAIGNC